LKQTFLFSAKQQVGWTDKSPVIQLYE